MLLTWSSWRGLRMGIFELREPPPKQKGQLNSFKRWSLAIAGRMQIWKNVSITSTIAVTPGPISQYTCVWNLNMWLYLQILIACQDLSRFYSTLKDPIWMARSYGAICPWLGPCLNLGRPFWIALRTPQLRRLWKDDGLSQCFFIWAVDSGPFSTSQLTAI